MWMIVLAMVIAAAAALAYSLTREKQYTASTSLLVRAPEVVVNPDANGAVLAGPQSTPERETANQLEIAQLDVVAKRAEFRLARRGRDDAAAAVKNVKTTSKQSSDLVSIKATGATPEAAALGANTFASEYVDFQRSQTESKLHAAQARLQAALSRLTKARTALARRFRTTAVSQQKKILDARIKLLSSRIEDVRIAASVATGGTDIVERASPPTKPSSPKPFRDALIGAFAGLLIGLALVLVRDQLDRRLTNSKQLAALLDVPLLARVPESRALKRDQIPQSLPAPEAEAFRMLRANIRHLNAGREAEFRSVLVTSPTIADGKSTIAFNLAAAAAATGARVLLMEADIRKPTLGGLLGLHQEQGITTILQGYAGELTDVVQTVPVTDRLNGRDSARTMDVVLAGRVPLNASELLESDRMTDLIRQAEAQYDLVVIDSAPATVVSDAIPLFTQVDAVIVIGRIGRVTEDQVERLREQLEGVRAPTLGVVANFTDARDGGYYGYGYTGRGASNGVVHTG